MKKRLDNSRTDIEECRDKIESILIEYNCSIKTDYHLIWLHDNDTKQDILFNIRILFDI